MTKGSSSKKKPKPPVEGPGVKLEKHSFKKPGKMGGEIDEIFAAKKRKGPENEKVDQKWKPPGKVSNIDTKSGHNVKKENKTKNKKMEETSFADSSSRRRKKTGDGLTIYTEEELGLGRPDAGGTPLCPFDCECCF